MGLSDTFFWGGKQPLFRSGFWYVLWQLLNGPKSVVLLKDFEIWLPFCICDVGRYLLTLMRKCSWLFISSFQFYFVRFCFVIDACPLSMTVLWLDNCAWLTVHSEVWIPWWLGDVCCLTLFSKPLHCISVLCAYRHVFNVS